MPTRTNATVPNAPIMLPRYTNSQLRSITRRLISRDAQAIDTKLLPVNSSAPATTTRIRPSENASPPSNRVTPKPSSESVTTTRKNTAPSEMKAPASTASTSTLSRSAVALATPTDSTRAAISLGDQASGIGPWPTRS